MVTMIIRWIKIILKIPKILLGLEFPLFHLKYYIDL